MNSGLRWLLLSAAGVALAVAVPARAQGPGGGPGGFGGPGGPGGGPGGPGAAAPGAAPRPATPARTTGQVAAYEPPEPIRSGTPISVLFFPFGFSGEVANAPEQAPAGAPVKAFYGDLTAYVSAAVKAGFLASPSFAVTTYHPNAALIQRGQKGGILTAEHLTALVVPATGMVDIGKAKVVAHRLAIQAILVGGVDVAMSGPNQVEVTVEGQLIDSTTGMVIRQATLSGAAAGAEGVSQETLLMRAGQEAAMKLVPALGIQLVRAAPAAVPAANSRSGGRKKAEPKKSEPKPARRTESSGAEERPARAPSPRVASASDDAAARVAREEERRAAEATAREERAVARQAEHDARRAREEAARAARAADRGRRSVRAQDAPTPVVRAQDAGALDGAEPKADGAAAPVVARDEPTSVALGGGVAPAPRATGPQFRGTANSAGQPVPYGYAIGDQKVLPKRDRSGLKVPPWLGIAAFLTGISFLL